MKITIRKEISAVLSSEQVRKIILEYIQTSKKVGDNWKDYTTNGESEIEWNDDHGCNVKIPLVKS